MIAAVLALWTASTAWAEGTAPVAHPSVALLRVATYDFPPLVSADARGKPRGLYIDLLEHVASEEGWTLEYVHGTWNECLKALSEGRVDLVPVVGYSDERAAEFAFSTEYPVLDWGVVFTRADSSIRNLFDLRGKRVGVLKGSIYTQRFRGMLDQFGITAELVDLPDYEAVFRALESGSTDAGINAQVSGAAIAQRYQAQPTQIYFAPVKLSYAAPKARRAVLAALDRHFAALKADPDSLWYELHARWMPGGPSRTPRWLLPVVGLASAAVFLSLGFAWVLRRQVAARTGELVKANASLRDSEALLRSFTDAIPDPIFMKDRDSRWLFANPGALAAVGRTREQVIGKTDADIYADGEMAAALMDNDRRIMKSGVAQVVEETVPTPTGNRVFLSAKVPLRGPGGEVAGIVGSARDITDRRRAEEALRESEHRFRSLNERASDVIVVTDEQGGITFASPSVLRVTGVVPEAIVGRSCFDFVHPDDLQAMRRSFEAVRLDPRARPVEELRIRSGDHRWLRTECELSNLLDVPSVRGIVLNGRDVTEQRSTEEQLRQSQKLESIGRLAGGVAHDFNNLLTVILSCAAVLEDEVRGNRTALDDVEQIREAGARAAGLTRQLLAFARKQVIAPVPLDVNEVVRDSEKLLRRVVGEDIEFLVSLEPDLWVTRCDPGQLEQVVMNLVVNARDAMPRGGRLEIATKNARVSPERHVPGAEVRPGEYVRLVIRDSGTGMSAAVQAHMFEPFFTTKPKAYGTGLGLATVYGIVKQSEGFIGVESAPGIGTTMTIWLPRASQAAVPTPSPRIAAGRRGEETILVVEDDPGVRDVTVRALRSGGYEVLVAPSGADALALDAASAARVQLLVTDVIMPGMDGRTLATELVRRHPLLRVLYMSGYTHDVIVERGVLGPGIEYLPKPFTAPLLLTRVRAVLDGTPSAARAAGAAG